MRNGIKWCELVERQAFSGQKKKKKRCRLEMQTSRDAFDTSVTDVGNFDELRISDDSQF